MLLKKYLLIGFIIFAALSGSSCTHPANKYDQTYSSNNQTYQGNATESETDVNSLLIEDESEKIYFDIVWTSEIKEYTEFKHFEKEDLNSDGIPDIIEYSFNVNHPMNPVRNVSLKINDSTITLRLENPSPKCYIVDINTNDKYKEIIVHEDGPSDDPISYYFYYNDKEIIEMGTLASNYYIKSGNSDIVYAHKAEQFEPQITVAYTKLDENHMFIIEKVDINSFINKKYKVNVPDHPENTTWKIFESFKDYYNSKGLVGEIHDGDTVTVLDLDTEYRGYTFKVRLDTGEEGWMVNLFAGN